MSYAAFGQESKSFRIWAAGLSFHIVNRCKQRAQAYMANQMEVGSSQTGDSPNLSHLLKLAIMYPKLGLLGPVSPKLGTNEKSG